MADFAVKVAELLLVREMTLDQQIGNLVKGSVFRQVRDIVTAVAQDALFTVNEGDLGLGGTGGGITRVEGNEPGLVTELEMSKPESPSVDCLMSISYSPPGYWSTTLLSSEATEVPFST